MSGVRVEKLFRHPLERVFDAFLDPRHVGEWLYATPSGVMEHVRYEPRPGGVIEIFERRGEELAEHHGVFIEIDRPHRIVFETRYADDPSIIVTVTFKPAGEGCLIVLEHALPDEWAHFVEGASKGWAMILTNLEALTGDLAMITAAPFLMFQGRCEEALTFYAAIVPQTTILSLDRKPDGGVAMARLSVAGLEIMANDSPPVHDFDFTPSSSIFLRVDAPEEVDRLATALGEGGKALMPPGAYGFSRRFGWVQDRFGVSWQINAA